MTKHYKNHKIVCNYVPSNEGWNPREYNDNSIMICMHRRYNLGDAHEYLHNQFNTPQELKQAILKDYNVVAILPLFLYDHSGISISTTPFKCRFDSCQVGFVFITKEIALSAFNIKRVTTKNLEKLNNILVNETKNYNCYLTDSFQQCVVVNKETEIEHEIGVYFDYDSEKMMQDAHKYIDDKLNNSKKEIRLKDINVEVKPSLVLCSIVLDDGSFVKEKYIGYKQSEAKHKFLQLLKSM